MTSRYLDLTKLLKNHNSALLFGPRGAGKSYLVTEFIKTTVKENIFKVDLLGLKTQTRYSTHPELFRSDIEYELSRSKENLFVFVDEVQKLPQLLDEVHYFLESEHKSRIQFLLTGSSARKLRRAGSNLLAGRALSLSLHPLSLLDLSLNLERVLQYGSLPKFYLEDKDTELLLDAYVETYLKEEIQAERIVRTLAPFQRFLDVAAQMNAKQINFSAVARDVGASDNTIRDYYSILLDTYLAFELPAWNRSVRKQLKQSSKFYFFDTGVLNALRGEQSLAALPGNRRYGDLFESFIVTEFFRQFEYLRIKKQLFYWATQQNAEIDLVIDRGLREPPIAIEIKSSDRPAPEKLSTLKSFAEEHPNALLFCLSRTSVAYKHEGVTVLPWASGIGEIIAKL